MTVRIGTSHFVSKKDAIKYYMGYEGNNRRAAKQAVERKLRDGEIHIGKPEVKEAEGESLIVLEGRYHIKSTR